MWEQARQALHQSMESFLTRFARLLPGLVALLVAFLVSLLLAWILALIVRRLLSSLRFDERLARWGFSSVAEWSPLNSPTRLVSRGIALLVILTGLLVGISAFDGDLTTQLVRTVFAYLPNILGALLVLFIGNVVARFIARGVLIGAVNMNFQYARLLSLGVKWLVMVLAVAMALEHLRIARGIVELAFGLLFGGIVLALALAVGLNAKELVTKSLERDENRDPSEAMEDPLRHL
jgi:ABC-type multidrug transport system fused ATPase/permease subunit